MNQWINQPINKNRNEYEDLIIQSLDSIEWRHDACWRPSQDPGLVGENPVTWYLGLTWTLLSFFVTVFLLCTWCLWAEAVCIVLWRYVCSKFVTCFSINRFMTLFLSRVEIIVCWGRKHFGLKLVCSSPPSSHCKALAWPSGSEKRLGVVIRFEVWIQVPALSLCPFPLFSPPWTQTVRPLLLRSHSCK